MTEGIATMRRGHNKSLKPTPMMESESESYGSRKAATAVPWSAGHLDSTLCVLTPLKKCGKAVTVS
jgi:hypothetical protein